MTFQSDHGSATLPPSDRPVKRDAGPRRCELRVVSRPDELELRCDPHGFVAGWPDAEAGLPLEAVQLAALRHVVGSLEPREADSGDAAPLPFGLPPVASYRMPRLTDLPPTPWQWREVGPGRADDRNSPLGGVVEDTSLDESEREGWALVAGDGSFLLSCDQGRGRVDGGLPGDLFEIAPLLAMRVRELERLIDTLLTPGRPAWGAVENPTDDSRG